MILNTMYLKEPEPEVTKYTVTITGTGNSTYSYVKIKGTKYTSAATVEVEEGTAVSCGAGTINASYGRYVQITLNGTTVAKGSNTSPSVSYEHTVDSDCNIALSYSGSAGSIAITTS